MNVNMECPKCEFVGTYEFDENEAKNLVVIKLVCGNCGLVDNGALFRQVEKAPKTLKQNLRIVKGIFKEIGNAYIEIGTTFRDVVRYEPSKLINLAGWFMGVGMFMFNVIPIATGAALDPEYVAGRQELINLAIGFGSLGFGIYMLRKRWDY